VSSDAVQNLGKKKVLGVPVLYLIGSGVLVLAVYAWRTKAVTPTDAAVTPSTGTTGSVAGTPELYPPESTGTVIVAPVSAPSGAGVNSSITTNDEWLKAGVAYLGKQGVGAGIAQVALQTYLEGSQLSYLQGEYRDQVIANLGMPPTNITSGGTDTKASTSLGYVKYTNPANGNWAIYELFADKTRRWINAAEWATKSSTTGTTNITFPALNAYAMR
jgi:hypothetical protein